MAAYGTKTRKSPEDVVGRAKDYFGEDGLGLEIRSDNPCCVTFEGGGGHVSVAASRQDDKTEVELETREWDYHAKKFLSEL
jgi:hypothetical protein